jgi:hypothetical protein
MASIVDRVRRYLRSPQGQKLVREGQRRLNDPKNRERLDRLVREGQRHLNDPRNRRRVEEFLHRFRRR